MILHIVNFMCHKQLDINLGNFSILTGENGSGKSAIFHSIDWLINGGTNNFITTDENYCKVSVEFDNNVISRIANNGKYSVELNNVVIGNTKESLSELNSELSMDFYNQFDKIYLLAETPKNRADMLNDIFDISSIEDVVSDLNTSIRATKSAIDNEESICNQTKNNINILKEVKFETPQIESDLNRLGTLQEYLSINIPAIPEPNSFEDISKLIMLNDYLSIIIKDVPKVINFNLDDSKLKLLNQYMLIEVKDVPKIINLNIDDSTLKLMNEYIDVSDKYFNNVDNVKALTKELDDIKSLLIGKNCPTCGQIIGG